MFGITSLDFTVNTTITDLIKWTPLGSITLITAHNSCSIREHSLCVTPSTEREIADCLGDVFSEEESVESFWSTKDILIYTNINLLRNVSDNINFVGSFCPLNMAMVEVRPSTSKPI